MTGEGRGNARLLVGTMARYGRAHAWSAAAIALALLLESAFGAYVPVSLGWLIDRAIPRHDERLLLFILVTLAAGAVAISALGVVRDYLYARAQSGILRDLRMTMFRRLQRLSLDYFGRTHTGDILARFSGDLATVEGAFVGAPAWVLLPACDVLVSTAVLFWLDWRLALVSLLIWPASVTGPRAFALRATHASHLRKRHEGEALAAVQENVAGQPTVRVFQLAEHSVRSFDVLTERLARSSRSVTFLSAMVERSAGIGINTCRVLVLAVGAVMALRGSISLGVLAAFQAVFLSLSSALSWISQYAPTVIQAAGSLERIRELLADEDESHGDASLPALPRLSGAIELRDVTVALPDGRRALNGVDARFERGASIAVVGPSGSGKSTLLGVLLRLQEPSDGVVLLDDRDIRRYSVESLRSQMSLVSQDSFLFGTSVAENIRIGRRDAADADVEAAARAAEIHDFIVALPKGYETRVGEGGMRLSGGQRQRLALARALVRDPEILLLDEATSALDAATEAAVNATLRRMSADRTVVSVTHRLASAVHADEVFVIAEGRVVERGTHTELLALGGAYARLWEKQNGFITGDAAGVEVNVNALRRVPLLSRLDDRVLAALAERFVTERFRASADLVHEGDVADKFYIVGRGRVEVTRLDPTGTSTLVAMIEDGDYFGEVGLLYDVPRNATVRTLTDTTCLVLDRDDFRRIIAGTPELREEMERAIRARPAMHTPISGTVVPH